MKALVPIDAAMQALAKATTVAEVKDLRDKAEAMRAYARNVHAGLEAQNRCAEWKIRCERKGGRMLIDMAERGERRGDGRKRLHDETVSLEELGIDKAQSHRWQLLARMDENEFEAELATCIDAGNELTSALMYRSAKRTEHGKTFDPGPIKGEYRIFYADPPWQYSDKLVEGYGPAEHHYPTLSMDQLCGDQNLPDGRSLPAMIDGAAAKDAVLFLWVTSPMLPDAHCVIESWGFEYKSSFVWDKVRHNYGHYNSVRHEFLLIAVRGSCLPEEKKLHDSVVSIERSGEHSRKPVQFRAMIERMYPNGNRLEVFAREEHEGWTGWGNQLIA